MLLILPSPDCVAAHRFPGLSGPFVACADRLRTSPFRQLQLLRRTVASPASLPRGSVPFAFPFPFPLPFPFLFPFPLPLSRPALPCGWAFRVGVSGGRLGGTAPLRALQPVLPHRGIVSPYREWVLLGKRIGSRTLPRVAVRGSPTVPLRLPACASEPWRSGGRLPLTKKAAQASSTYI